MSHVGDHDTDEPRSRDRGGVFQPPSAGTGSRTWQCAVDGCHYREPGTAESPALDGICQKHGGPLVLAAR
jgi:hypothetical protein